MSPRSQDIKQSGLFGFLAQPDEVTTAGVVILPTIFGVNAFVRGYAETLARAGLAAAVWDQYEGLPLTTDYDESKKRARTITDAAMHGKAKAWIDYMFGDLRLTSVGVLGFCLGGRFAPLVAASDKRMKACAAAYPSIENPPASQPGAGSDHARGGHHLSGARHPTRPRPRRHPADLCGAEGEPAQARRADDLAVLPRRRARLHAPQGTRGQPGGDGDRVATARRLPQGLPVVTGSRRPPAPP